jgi:hypothetical protein
MEMGVKKARKITRKNKDRKQIAALQLGERRVGWVNRGWESGKVGDALKRCY